MISRNLRNAAAVIGALGTFAMAAPAAAQGCTREGLEEFAAGYVKAHEEGSIISNLPLGEWTVVRENGSMSSMSTGFLSTPRKVAWHMSLVDPMQCRVFVEAVSLDPEPYVTGGYFSDGYFGVGDINIVTSTTGDWLFDAEKTYEYARREDWGVVPEAQRSTREQLMAAANAYLDMFKDNSVDVPWGTPCRRLEGGVYTGRGEDTDSCNVGVPEGIDLVKRQYIVDEEKSAVAVFLRFGGDDGLADVHTFRVIDGKITNIHTITNCGGENNCGFGSFEEMVAKNPAMQPDPALFGAPRD